KEIAFVQEGITTHLKAGGQWRGKGLTDGALDIIIVFDRELTALEVARVAGKNALVDLLKKSPEAWNDTQRQALFDYFLANYEDTYQKEIKALNTLRSDKNALVETVPEVMVMDEMETPRPTYLLERKT